jgi:micrococcal nuclease
MDMDRKSRAFLLAFLIIILIAINYSFLDTRLENFLDESEYAHVIRVIDGDTVKIDNNESVRLLGINTPEKGEKYYKEAKEFLESLILNKTVKLEFTNDRYDKYERILAYIFLEDENINVRIVKNGFGNYYFYSGFDKYSDDLKKAWSECIKSNRNLCEASTDTCAKCIKTELNYIINNCTFSCDISGWQIKGEGREKFIFNGTLDHDEMAGFELDITDSGGSLFLRDDMGKLVEWGVYR